MIKEAFLSCALAAAPMAMTHKPLSEGPIHIAETIEAMRKALNKYPRHHGRLGIEGGIIGMDKKITGKVLVVGGDPIHVKTMREYRLNAFGALTEDYIGVTPYHAVTDIGKLSFLDLTFEAVFWHHISPDSLESSDALFDALMLIVPGGYFIFNEKVYPEWADYLREHGWEKHYLEYQFQLSIWQNAQKLITLPFYEKFKNILPFIKVPKWRMLGQGLLQASA